MSVIDLLDQLEGLFVNGRRVVFTPNVLVNEDEALDLIDRTRMDLPEEIKQARWTVEHQEKLVADAEEAARRMTDSAREEAEATVTAARAEAERLHRSAVERAERLVGETEVMRAGREQADALVRAAEDRAMTIRADADSYARDVMKNLQSHLEKVSATVRRGIESLAEEQGRARGRG